MLRRPAFSSFNLWLILSPPIKVRLNCFFDEEKIEWKCSKEEYAMKLNEQIREHRKKLGLTQEQIADSLGVSTPAVNKWESGVSQS